VIPKWQFLNDEGDLEVNVGDEVEVALDLIEDGLGATLLSRDKAKKHRAWGELETAFWSILITLNSRSRPSRKVVSLIGRTSTNEPGKKARNAPTATVKPPRTLPLTDYGAFIDLGGIDGLLHITDMAWRRVRHPSECVEIGQEIEVKVLKFDKEKTRVSLGMDFKNHDFNRIA
jgi:small subunit ribosomal protein S1